MCKPAGFKYYNGYGSLNISELHGLSTVACTLFYTVCRNRFVETASIKPQCRKTQPQLNRSVARMLLEGTIRFQSL